VLGFYTDVHADGRNLYSWLSEDLSGIGTFKVYNLDDPKPRQPVYTANTNQGGGTNGNGRLPNEVALCLSLKADIPSGVDPSSRKGRIYIGPLRANPGGSPAYVSGCDPATGRPPATLMATMISAAESLSDEIAGLASWDWGVYSPTLDTFSEIKGGWVDNAMDTQRRRGIGTTARTSFTL
jgi:hypothetical protein